MIKNFPLIDGAVCFNKKNQLAKNISLFRSDGTKVYWGDLSKTNLKKLKDRGVFYVLSEHKSYWDVPKRVILEYGKNHNLNAIMFGLTKVMDTRDKTKLLSEYVKDNKIAVIVDGVWIRDDNEWARNYS